MVRHEASGRQVRYADVVSLAATLKPPKEVALKPASEFRLIGQPVKRLDTPAKTDGSAQFGCDVRVPGMLYATVLRSPTIGGRLRSHDATAARAVKGVRDVIAIDSGIAVVADNTWAALRGRQALQAEWDSGKTAQLDSAAIREHLRKATTRRGKVMRDEGDAEKALKGATRRIDALYETPYLAHACMEPMNCTAWVRADKAEVWVPTQSPAAARRTAARISGLNESAVQIHTTFLGGGFGRRLSQDFVAEAVAVAKVVRAPVQVMWTREDDMRNDFYRPANCTTLSAVLDAGGAPLAWFQRVAGPSRALWGIDLPYAIPDILIEQVEEDPGVPTGAWRSVGASQNAYVSECFIDELARAAGKDPYLYRRALLTNQPRYRDVLDLAAGMYGWERKLPAGRHRGIALVRSFGSYVAQVAEVSVGNGEVRVHRVVCAVDCGMYVNPNIIAAQMESGIIFGLTAALKGEITLDHGRIVQGNFNDYPLLTMAESPEIEVHIVQSSEAPGGVGEPGTPPIAPAVANAVYAATGRPVRRLPIRL
jgi:isoquinoline 1-oxidoreductase beta subunit